MAQTFNIVFMGGWGRGRSCIEALHRRKDVDIKAVFTQFLHSSKDPYFNLVHDFAVAHQIPVVNIHGNSSKAVSQLILDYLNHTEEKNILGVSVAFEKIFKKNLLAHLRIVNLHPSWLPQYRGPSPELWAIKNRDPYIGITLHWVNEGIDCGNILYQERFELDYGMTYLEFADWLNMDKSPKVMDSFFDMCPDVKMLGREQEHLSLYYPRLQPRQGLFDMKLEAISELLNDNGRLE